MKNGDAVIMKSNAPHESDRMFKVTGDTEALKTADAAAALETAAAAARARWRHPSWRRLMAWDEEKPKRPSQAPHAPPSTASSTPRGRRAAAAPRPHRIEVGHDGVVGGDRCEGEVWTARLVMMGGEDEILRWLRGGRLKPGSSKVQEAPKNRSNTCQTDLRPLLGL